jgi:hypothetical protein
MFKFGVSILWFIVSTSICFCLLSSSFPSITRIELMRATAKTIVLVVHIILLCYDFRSSFFDSQCIGEMMMPIRGVVVITRVFLCEAFTIELRDYFLPCDREDGTIGSINIRLYARETSQPIVMTKNCNGYI